jgi:hypothetical protein
MRLVLKISVVVVSGVLCSLAGWMVGALIGGNYAVDFTFNGVRGYEATGQLGFVFGLATGGVLGWYAVFKGFGKR